MVELESEVLRVGISKIPGANGGIMKNKWATVSLGPSGEHHICVYMRKNESEEDVRLRVENSIWGPPAKVIGVYPTPWNKEMHLAPWERR